MKPVRGKHLPTGVITVWFSSKRQMLSIHLQAVKATDRKRSSLKPFQILQIIFTALQDFLIKLQMPCILKWDSKKKKNICINSCQVGTPQRSASVSEFESANYIFSICHEVMFWIAVTGLSESLKLCLNRNPTSMHWGTACFERCNKIL